MESSSDELPEIEGTSTLWKGDEQSQSEFQPVDSEETKSEGENETTMTDNVKPLVLSEELSRVLCLNEGSSTKVTQNEGAENLPDTHPIQSYESENVSATTVPTESHASLLSEELKNVLSFNEERSKNVNLVAGEPENDFENVEGEKTIDDNVKTLKRPIRTATRRLRSHNRSRRYQHERSTLSYSDEADVHEVHSSITRFGSINDLQHDVSVLHIKRKRSHSADSSDFPASFSDSSPQATDPSTDEELPTCATCGKCFRKKYSLVKHVFTHVPDVSKPLHVCKDCGKVIPTASVLRKHRRVHLNEIPDSYVINRPDPSIMIDEHPLGVRTYRCPYCFRSFNQFEFYRRHLNVHTGRHFGRHIYRL